MVNAMEDEDFQNLVQAHLNEAKKAVAEKNTYRAKSECNIVIGILELWREQE